MFGFLMRLFRRKKSVERLRLAWAAHRTPAVAEELARALLDRGSVDEALALLKEAYRLFPRADRIRTWYHHTLRLKSSQEIRALRQAIATDGRPEMYARLAELYRYLGHFEEAIEIAGRGIQRFPTFSGNHLAIGRIHYTRFLKTSTARDGRQASACLERAFELDPQNFKTLFHLTNLYLTVGDGARARAYLERLTMLISGDSRINDLWERLSAAAKEGGAAETDSFARYEASRLGSLTHVANLPVTQEVRDRLAAVKATRGVERAILFDQAGGVAHALPEPNEQAVASAHALFESARLHSRRMSIGTFKQGAIAGKRVRILLFECEGVGLAVFGGPQLRDDTVGRKAAALFESCMCEASAP